MVLTDKLRLNLFFTVASITANVSALPIGTTLDRFGPRICTFSGCFCLTIGSVLMSLAHGISAFDGYVTGNFFLSLGGTFIFMPAFQLANAFPKRSRVIVALVTGAFDASAAVFLFYRLAYEATNHAFKPSQFFMWYLVVPLLIFLAQVLLLPSKPYKTTFQLEVKIEAARNTSRDFHESDEAISDDEEVDQLRAERRNKRRAKLKNIDNVLGDSDQRLQREEREEERQVNSRVWGGSSWKTGKGAVHVCVVRSYYASYCVADAADELFYCHDSCPVSIHAELGTSSQRD